MTPPPPRLARILLLDPAGAPLGALPTLPVVTPWWQDIAPVVQAAREAHGVEIIVLRLISVGEPGAEGVEVTYLAQAADAPENLAPWDEWAGALVDHPLRLAYARPGGPAADLAWATGVLEGAGHVLSGRPEQVRTWNLSSLWRLPVRGGSLWLKVVPPFFAHEGAMMATLAGAPVPRLVARDGARMLMEAIPGEDLYAAGGEALSPMVDLLVALQREWIDREDELIGLGLPDWRAVPLTEAIARVVARNAVDLDLTTRARLAVFVQDLPRRFAAIEACCLPDTLVHGDFHPGNLRGEGGDLTLLDWGDCGLGHPLLDQSAFLDRIPPDDVAAVRRRWLAAWAEAAPGSESDRAAELIAPIAAARQAVIYQGFLDRIEPSEHVYHAGDPADWLGRAAALVEREEARR